MKPQMPAMLREPCPVAASSRISPPTPVAAPGNGEIAVGWLWVSTFISWSSESFLKPYSFVLGSIAKTSVLKPETTAELSRYAESVSWGRFLCVFLIISKSDFGCFFPLMTNSAPKILWRQCSELTWPNITSSVSVGLRPADAKLLARYSISGSEMASPSSSFASRIAATPLAMTSKVRPGFGSATSKRSEMSS